MKKGGTEMEFRHVGNSGLTVSAIGLGCVSFGRRADEPGRTLLSEDRACETIEAALDAGITLFDTSDSYGDGEKILAKYVTGHRDDIVIATKFGNSVSGALGNDFGARGARRYIRRAVERSLRRLNTDWIDLYQMHSPDPSTPIEETLSVLSDLVHEGKVRYLGSSNFNAWQIADADWISSSSGYEHFISVQNHYSLIARRIEEDIVPACLHYGLGVITLRPLGEGLLTGKYRRGGAPPDTTRKPRALGDRTFDIIEALEGFATKRGITLLDVAIGGLAAQSGVASIIAGATTAAQVRANVSAGEWKPTVEDNAELDEITKSSPPWPQDPTGVWPNLGFKREKKEPEKTGAAGTTA
jgi:aryl-alcohol dehydrogenase-like predicted oxidoreductase